MTELNPAADLQNRTDHTAQNDRLALQGLAAPKTTSFGTQGGVRITDGLDLKVTQNTGSDMNVKIAAGQALIPGSENTFQGSYFAANDANVVLAIAASNPTLGRIDLVVAKVQDAFYSGGTNAWSLAVVTGTAAGSPVAPAAPANSIILAQVSVAAAVTAIVNANITDKRQALTAAGGIIVATSATRTLLSNVATGQYVYETDTKLLYYWDSAAWARQTPIIDVGAITIIPDNTSRTASFNFTFPSAPTAVHLSVGLLTGNTVVYASVFTITTTGFSYRGVVFPSGNSVSTSGTSIGATYTAILK